MSTVILLIGLMVFVSHFLSLQFRRTNIPDVLVLMGIGLLIGPWLGWIQPEDFGKVGGVIATIALVVILFESGTSLRLDVLGKSLSTTVQLALACFGLTALIVTAVGVTVLGMSTLGASMLGVILAGTSSAVVIPLVESLKLSDKPGTVLVLESALTDVLCIVGVFALLQVVAQGHIAPGALAGSVLAALVFAGLLGVLGGIGWLLILGKVRDFPNTISSTLAYAFIVYGVSEFLGFSGAIAAMTLGLTLANFKQVGGQRFKSLDPRIEALTPVDMAFYREAVFLLKTYFFVYLGISIQFSDTYLIGVAVLMFGLVLVMRLVLTRLVTRPDEYSLRDAAITSMLAPKGLAAAVLATIPLQQGMPEGELIRDAAYMVVLVSIAMCALLIMVHPHPAIQRLYGRALGRDISKTPESNGDRGADV